jgi:hypothetical protein
MGCTVVHSTLLADVATMQLTLVVERLSAYVLQRCDVLSTNARCSSVTMTVVHT